MLSHQTLDEEQNKENYFEFYIQNQFVVFMPSRQF